LPVELGQQRTGPIDGAVLWGRGVSVSITGAGRSAGNAEAIAASPVLAAPTSAAVMTSLSGSIT
jgi:phosphoribosylcarboxyaminoimidazole (NCAIR) mutase